MALKRHIGLIAGGGQLPRYVAEAVRRSADDLSVIAIDPDCPAKSLAFETRFPLSKFGKMLRHLERANVTHICLAGQVRRPDFSEFKPDLAAMRYLPGTLKAARNGDDALLRHIMRIFEKRGFEIVSAQSLCADLLLRDGPLGQHMISSNNRDDALKAMELIEALGPFDIGQAAVVTNGVVLAVEAQEGTDAMLERVATLDPALRGMPYRRAGVLAKRPKPTQDLRVDMPVIGPRTVELASEAGLSGIIAESGCAFVIDRESTIQLADELGLFIIGLPAQKEPSER